MIECAFVKFCLHVRRPADVASDAGGVISGLEREITEFRDIHHIHTLQVQGGLRL